MLKELIIKVNNTEVYLSPELIVPIQQTNVPIEHCRFHSHEDIYWKVELLEYNSDNKCWRLRVIDYYAKDISNFNRQKSTREVERIAFEKFDWQNFESHLSYYHKIKLLDVLDNHNTDRFFRESLKRYPAIVSSNNDSSEQNTADISAELQNGSTQIVDSRREPYIKTLSIEFRVYFSDAQFMLGYVAFSKSIKEINDKVDFKIKNDCILAEFENIKSWFVKKLRTKKFTVNAAITTTDGKVTQVTATSPQILMINEDLIESIRYQRTFELTKSPKVSGIDKSLFTAEEIFGEMESNDIEGNVFSQNEQDILSYLLDNKKPRNRKQLEYLSGSKQSESVKLKFTLHPNFGFLFFIDGKNNNHFVWELLNSHATYIWSIDKSENEIELQYKRIEESINIIRDIGRQQYKLSYRQNHHDIDLLFDYIEHNSINSDFVDGFVKWKHKLNEKLT